MIRIGYHHVEICNYCDETRVVINGELECKGNVRIGNGAKVHVASRGILSLGKDFHISASSSIECYHRIVIGNNVLFGWNVLIMDTDGHPIMDEDNNVINKNLPIKIGDKVWVGSYSRILKGSIIPENCVIGACSVVSGHDFEGNTVIVGVPAKSKKHIGGWKELYPNFHRL